MKQSASDSQYLAGLSGLALSDAETQALGTDIDNIITYITMLDELDVADVEPTYQVTDLENVWRKDEVIDGGVTREQLLSLAPETLENQVKVPQVL
jgi:aspartyl-tRNA(Asn)/glutamyl-tRNA(Gln) amidotransferase subunit C